MAGVKYLFPGEFKKPYFSDKYKIRGFFFSVWNYKWIIIIIIIIITYLFLTSFKIG
jgi:hypothetical protein